MTYTVLVILTLLYILHLIYLAFMSPFQYIYKCNFFLHLLSILVQYLWKSDFAFTITDKTKSRLVRDVNLHDVYNLRTFDDTWLYAFLQLFKIACIKKLMHQKVVWNLLSDKFLLIYLLWIMLSLFILNFRRLLCMHGWFRDGSKRLIHWGCTDCTDCTDS